MRILTSVCVIKSSFGTNSLMFKCSARKPPLSDGKHQKKRNKKKKREGYFHLCCGNVHFKLAGVFEIKKNKQKGHEPDRTASALSWGLCVCVCKLCWVFHWWCSLLNISAATAKLFKANLWFVGWNKTGFGVIHLWAYRYWLKNKMFKEMRENINIQTGNELQHDPLLHSHLWFPWATGYNRTGLKTACGSRLCCSSSRAHCERLSSFMLLKHWMLSWIHLAAKKGWRVTLPPPPPSVNRTRADDVQSRITQTARFIERRLPSWTQKEHFCH